MIIGISGKIKSGKSTAVDFIKKFDNRFIEKQFAYKLKAIAALLTGDDINKYQTQEGKAEHLPLWNMTRREILQKLGTDALRNNFHQQVHVKGLIADINPATDHVIVSDVRFRNEADFIKELGGVIIRINRPMAYSYPNEWAEYTKTNTWPFFLEYLEFNNVDLFNTLSHPSETGMDDYDRFDCIIENDASLKYLERDLQEILTGISPMRPC
jgi:hypothetical protein